ncbi:S-adenosylmethionine decarboxylase proenzyme, prokaryotic class 1B [hydrothermal vent metagenome]|uniref:S-adenosylmethionine decarboxylase proenzyme, prokaryotic class 1B n=1 Tax=hydrothermal vent metagenome TaxID=652676 RepID=A0A3B0WHR0_9ZZZZ
MKVESTKDHFIVKQGVEYSGTHLLIDLWGAEYLTDQLFIETALVACTKICNAQLLHIHLHQFTDTGGISGVAVLAESHISVHTWPERQYAAFDVFMCGLATPHKAVDYLKETFKASTMNVQGILRGHNAPDNAAD